MPQKYTQMHAAQSRHQQQYLLNSVGDGSSGLLTSKPAGEINNRRGILMNKVKP